MQAGDTSIKAQGKFFFICFALSLLPSGYGRKIPCIPTCYFQAYPLGSPTRIGMQNEKKRPFEKAVKSYITAVLLADEISPLSLFGEPVPLKINRKRVFSWAVELPSPYHSTLHRIRWPSCTAQPSHIPGTDIFYPIDSYYPSLLFGFI